MSIVDKIVSRVEVNAETGCWEWQGARSSRGYGTIWINGSSCVVSRVMFAESRGPIPDGLWVLHRCDNPPCCNPDHLFLGTHQDNVDDRVRKGRGTKGERVPVSKLTAEDIPAIVARLRAGESQADIARDYGVSYISIGEIKRGGSWRHISGGPVLEARTTAKLTPDKVTAIRRMLAAGGKSQQQIANEIGGISRATVQLISAGKIWKELT